MEEDFDIRQEQGRKGEKDFENALRPLRFGDFSGQQKVVENLEVFVEAAKYRGVFFRFISYIRTVISQSFFVLEIPW